MITTINKPIPREYTPDFLWNNVADEYLHHFQSKLDRQQHEIRMFGKKMMQPRLISFYADETIKYSYSNTHFHWSWREEHILLLKEQIKKETWYTFNSVLCNLYRNGNDSMWRHADNEKELWPDPIIASLSLWAERIFHLKHRQTQEKEKILLQHGSLLLMKQWTQTQRKHAIMKTKKIVWPRINLTFRNIVG